MTVTFQSNERQRSTRDVIDRIHFFVDKTSILKDHEKILLFFLSHNNNEQQARGRANVCVFNQIFGGEIDHTLIASLPRGKVTAYPLSTLLFAHQLYRVINFLEGYAQFRG